MIYNSLKKMSLFPFFNARLNFTCSYAAETNNTTLLYFFTLALRFIYQGIVILHITVLCLGYFAITTQFNIETLRITVNTYRLYD